MKSTTNGTTTGTNGGRKNGHSIRMQTMEKIGRNEAPDSGLDRRQLLSALRKFQKGSFDVRLSEHWTGLDGKIADAFNAVVERNQRMAQELERLSTVVGKQGKLGKRGSLGDAPWGHELSAHAILEFRFPLKNQDPFTLFGHCFGDSLDQTSELYTFTGGHIGCS